MEKKFIPIAATLIAFCAFNSTSVYAAVGEATVILLRGNAKTEKGSLLKLQDKIGPGTSITTEAKSFVKILFKDNTQMNIGPDTTMKIEPVKSGETSIVSLVGGQIRAKVTKDLLKGDNAPTEKLIIKTKTAAMGIRGTDFNVSFNKANQNTALITFEGNVAMTKLDPGETPQSALRQTDKVQSVGAGQYSGAQPNQSEASVPVKISPAQLETMKSNETFKGMGEKSAAKTEAMASPIPPGVDPKNFASGAEKALAASMGATDSANSAKGGDDKGPPPEGFFNAKTGDYAPRAGGFIDLNSGIYVPPPPGSSFDPNTGVYVPPQAVGGFDAATGMYVPPKGVDLDPVRGFVAEAKSADGTRSDAPPPPEMMSFVMALNTSMMPENAGVDITFSQGFGPSAGGDGGFVMPPPPPPGTDLPPPPDGLLPPPEPVDNPFCPTCQSDNIQQSPTSTTTTFSITVGP